MKGYGEHWQYSIFFCVLREIDRVRLQSDLADEINQKDDQVLIFDLGADEDSARRSVTTLGEALPKSDSRIIIV